MSVQVDIVPPDPSRPSRSLRSPAQALERHFGLNFTLATITVAVLAAVLVGATLTSSTRLAVLLVASVAFVAVLARWGLPGILLVVTGTLPWLVVLSSLLPRTVATATAGVAAVFAVLVLAPKADGSRASSLLRLGLFLFFGSVVISLARPGSAAALLDSAQLIQAAKYAVFPLMVLVVTEATNRTYFVPLRTVALGSAALAVTVNLVLGVTGVANTSYYGSGEILGFGSEHSLALLAGFVTAATIASNMSLKSALPAAIGAIATVATGVRSTLPGLALAAIGRMLSAGTRLRTFVVVGVAVAAVFASGAAQVVEDRFHRGESRGEFQSLRSLGSGRGAIYETAIDTWWGSSPVDWLIGTGLRTIHRISEERLGEPLGGHSDVLQVGVELGVIGLVGFLLIWGALIARAESKLPLLVLASFALLNGTLEYGPPLVIGLILTAGLRKPPDRRQRSANDEMTPLRGTPPALSRGFRSQGSP